MPLPDLGEAAAELAAELTAAGVRTVVDARDLGLPGGWLTPRRISEFTLDGGFVAEWELYLVAGDHPATALGELSTMLAPLVERFVSGDVEAVTLSLPNHSASPLPALSVPIRTAVTP